MQNLSEKVGLTEYPLENCRVNRISFRKLDFYFTSIALFFLFFCLYCPHFLVAHFRGESLQTSFKGAPSGLRQFLAIENHLKMMQEAFYFTLKTLFVLNILKFCLDFVVM